MTIADEEIEERWSKYCKICGSRSPIRQETSYDPKTGQKVISRYYAKCDKEDCQHGHHDYRGLFKVRCVNCGQKIPPAYIEGE